MGEIDISALLTLPSFPETGIFVWSKNKTELRRDYFADGVSLESWQATGIRRLPVLMSALHQLCINKTPKFGSIGRII